jgi:hypothetical protein
MLHATVIAMPVTKASSSLRASIAKLIEKHGTAEAAKLLHVGREPLTRILADLTVREGTLNTVEKHLAQAMKL